MKPIEKLRSAMREKNLSAVLVTDELNQRYLTGFPFTDGYVLVLPEKAYLVTDFRYTEAAGMRADKAFTVEAPGNMLAFIDEILRNEKAETMGYEDDTLPAARAERYREFFSAKLVPLKGLFLSIRAVKEQEELAKMAKAQEITDAAFTHILDVINENMTELDVALEIEFFMRKHGAEKVSFDLIAVSGSQSSLPHGVPRPVKLEKGFFTMDTGCIYEGYCSDMTRTVVLGKATPEMRRLYNTVLTAQTSALEAIKPGANGKAVDKVARDIIENAGYHGAFGHSLGHGVGMFIHESPRLAPRADDVILVPGNVVTDEPGIYLAGKYGCRIEDMVAVTNDGHMNFTKSTKDLIELF